MIIKTITAFINPSDIEYQDGGHAQILTIADENEENQDEGVFVRIQSWYEKTLTHPEMEKLKGKMLKVTIETIDDESSTIDSSVKSKHFKEAEVLLEFINSNKIEVISICAAGKYSEGYYLFYKM